MQRRVRRALAAGLIGGLSLGGVRTQAQSPLDGVVGPDFFGKPLVLEKLTAADIGALAAAARMPMGFEAAVTGGPVAVDVKASGKSVRAVLDAIVRADPRYEWREEGSVIVLRPAAAWTDRDDVLHRNVAAIRFDDVGIADAMAITVGLFGQTLHATQRNDLGDQKRFNLDLPPGTVIDALNGIVRAHGALAWGLEPFPPTPPAPGSVVSPFMVSLVSGRAGQAQGIGVHFDREPQVPEQLERWGRPLLPTREPALERVVGARRNGEPLILRSAFDVPELAAAARVPMGVELLPPGEPRPSGDGVTVTGLSLRDALTALMALDSRYEWREVDGVVVVRPLFAWTDPEHPLSRQTGAVRLDAVTLEDAIDFQQTLLEPGMKFSPARDRGLPVPRISVNLAGGTHLSLLVAMAKSHGELCWIYEDLNDADARFFGGRQHQLSFRSAAGAGHGFAFR